MEWLDLKAQQAAENEAFNTRWAHLAESDFEPEGQLSLSPPNQLSGKVDTREKHPAKSSFLVGARRRARLETPPIQLHKLLNPDERQDFEIAVQPATMADTIWRHAGWHLDRNRVFDVIRRVGSKGVVDRFANCGSCATVEYSPSSCEVRIRASFCRNRWCVPCARARARQDESKLRGIVQQQMDDGKQVRLVTLTQRGYMSEGLKKCLTRMNESWQILRKSAFWKDHVDGGVAVTEVKRGKSGSWHVHRHLIVTGSYIPADELSAEWEQITEDSFRVYVEAPRDAEQAIEYATKYACKPVPPEVYRNSDDLTEAVLALKGVRLFDYFGTWRKVEAPEVDRPTDWRRVDTIHQLARRAAAGDLEAWSWLSVAASHGIDELVRFADPPPDPSVHWWNHLDDAAAAPHDDHADESKSVWAAITAGRKRFLFDGVSLRLPA